MTALVAFFPSFSNAQDYGLGGGSFYVDFSFSVGMGKVEAKGLTKAPTLGAFSPSLSLGYNVWDALYLGVTAKYDYIIQISKVEDGDGNYRGSQLIPYSLLLLYRTSFADFKLNYIFSGEYTLANKTSSDKTLAYTEPQGLRLSIPFFDYWGLRWGPFYESLKYSKQMLDGKSSKLINDLTFSQYGIEVSYIF